MREAALWRRSQGKLLQCIGFLLSWFRSLPHNMLNITMRDMNSDREKNKNEDVKSKSAKSC